MNQVRIQGGTKYICCNHVQKNGFNERVFCWDLSKPKPREIFDKVMAVEEARGAKWIILCHDCEMTRRRGEPMVEGVPYHTPILARDTVIEVRSES